MALLKTATDCVMFIFRMRKEPTSEEPSISSSGTYDECAIFIDDSNIFIEGQKYYSRRLNLRSSQDPRFRIDFGKLADLALNGRTMCYGKLYGSKPPDLDSLWNKVVEQGLAVQVFEKDSKGGEKEVDTGLTADAVEFVCESQAEKLTVIIISGDRDFRPIAEKIFKKKDKWKVEVLAFKQSISQQWKDIKNANFEVIELESLLRKNADICCFIEAGWRDESLSRKSLSSAIILHFKKSLISPEANQSEKMQLNQLLKQYAEKITSITHVPCYYYLWEQGPNAGRLVYVIAGYETDLFSMCNMKASELNQACFAICDLYEKYTDANDESQLQNIGLGDGDDSAMETTTDAEGFTKVRAKSKAKNTRRSSPTYVDTNSAAKKENCVITHIQKNRQITSKKTKAKVISFIRVHPVHNIIIATASMVKRAKIQFVRFII